MAVFLFCILPRDSGEYVRASGWKPWSAKLHVGNVENLVRRLGGETLYGEGSDKLRIALRELIQNARDAVVARRSLDPGYHGKITARITRLAEKSLLEVEDDGVGMSERILTGPLLDFGSSFWASDLVKTEFPGLRASGFQSVGQYGIGFFSIFMVSDEVRVRSRRWDRGFDSVCELHFPKGLSLRPIVSLGNARGFSGYTSTVVSCTLKSDVINEPRTKELHSGYAGVPPLEVEFSDYLASLIPGLDVLVELEIDAEKPIVIHSPVSSLLEDNQLATWLSRICFLKYYKDSAPVEVQKLCSRLRAVKSNDDIVGIAALSGIAEHQLHLRGVHTIGGFATESHLRTDAGFIGYLEVHPTSARREGHSLAIEQKALRAWGDEQIKLLRAEALEPINWCFVTASLAKLDLDPSDVLHAMFFRKNSNCILNLDQIVQVLGTEPIALFKSSFMEHVDSYVGQNYYEDYLTFAPLINSAFLSLELEDGIPKYSSSLIGCLNKRLQIRGRKLKFEIRKSVFRSALGVTDAVLVSAV